MVYKWQEVKYCMKYIRLQPNVVLSLFYLQQNDIKKFVKLCAVLSDIQSLISKEDKIANISDSNNQRVSFEAAVAVSKSVEMNMCNWVSLLGQ